jgi:hypothetical protein
MTWLRELIKPNKRKSEFLIKKPKLTKIVGYNDRLSFNETFIHIYKQNK